MIPLAKLENLQKTLTQDTGYRSCYAFREEYAKEIKASGSSKGLNKYPVASDTLYIDLDDHSETLPEIEQKLQEKGYRYSLWFSGKKGYHIYLYHDFIEDIDLPYSHKRFVVDTLKIKCDESLYQHGRIISLPGRLHPDTKIKKHLIKEVEGKKITFPILKPVKKPNFDFSEDISNKELLLDCLMRLTDLVSFPPRIGMRHTRVWGAARDLRKAGINEEIASELLQKVNNVWTTPKTDEEIQQAVHQAYHY